LFLEYSEDKLKSKVIVDIFELVLGLKINWQKITISVTNLDESKEKNAAERWSCNVGNWLLPNLGVKSVIGATLSFKCFGLKLRRR